MRSLRLLAAGAFLAALLPGVAHASGNLVKGSTPAVYYLDAGKRYVFPNERVYFSWYPDFSQVTQVSDEELASYQIGGNVTYKPGFRLVKIQSDPRVYAVGAGGVLRWIASEDAARALYGADWNRQIDDIPDAFFLNYGQGEPIMSSADFDREGEGGVGSIADDLTVRAGGTVPTEFTAVKFGTWSDNAVWGGRRPGAGARVTIPAGIKVIYDMEESPSLRALDVRGTLEFYGGKSTRLAAKQITVRGELTIGADAPLDASKTAEIVLTGAATAQDLEDGLTVDGGRLTLRGAPVATSWTRLASPAKAGDATVELEAPVDWRVGSEIVVLGAKAGDAHETRVVTAVDGAVVTLDAPLESDHRAETGLRSEVALLTRNVVVRGVGGGAGSYVRAINRAAVDIDAAAFVKLGRKGVEGEYPLYLDGLAGGTVRDSVIRSSGNRCLALRQTRNAIVEGNVAFDAYGHCFATVDGSETGNAFLGNLAAAIHPGALPGDAVPAAFYLKNPDNRLETDAAVASEGFGYWYDLSENALLNDGTTLKPRQTALGGFSGNLARGNRKTGLFVDDNDKGRMNYIPSAKASFSGYSGVMNGERGFWMRGVNLEVAGAYLAENAVGGSFAAFGASLRNSTVVGRLEGSAPSDEARTGFVYHDGPVSVTDTVFKRFDGDADAALGFQKENPSLTDPRNSLRGATFVEARPWRLAEPVTAGDAMSVVRDLDAGDVVGADSDFLGAACVRDEDETAHALRCPGPYVQLLVALRDGSGTKNVVVTNLETSSSVTLVAGETFDGEYAYANVAEGGSYRFGVPNVLSVHIEYPGTTAPLLLRIPVSSSASLRSGTSVIGRVEPEALAPGSWAYDAAKSEAVLWLSPGASLDLTR